MKTIKARLLSEAEARRKEKQQELATKKMHAVTEEICEPEPVTAAVTSRSSLGQPRRMIYPESSRNW